MRPYKECKESQSVLRVVGAQQCGVVRESSAKFVAARDRVRVRAGRRQQSRGSRRGHRSFHLSLSAPPSPNCRHAPVQRRAPPPATGAARPIAATDRGRRRRTSRARRSTWARAPRWSASPTPYACPCSTVASCR